MLLLLLLLLFHVIAVTVAAVSCYCCYCCCCFMLLLLLLLLLLVLVLVLFSDAVAVAVAAEDSTRRIPNRADFGPTWGSDRKSAARATHVADDPGSAAGMTPFRRVQQKCTNRTGAREITTFSAFACCIVDM